MRKARSRATNPAEAVQRALEHELAKRNGDMKPIELVKVAISAYQSFTFNEDGPMADADPCAVESADSIGLRRGTQSAVDRLLFNANYWCAAYEKRIVAACDAPDDARACLQAVSVWTAHTLKLNTLSPTEAVAIFERFCPPFALNHRRGSHERSRTGKGPLPDLKRAIDELRPHASQRSLEALDEIVRSMEREAADYEALGVNGSLQALFDILPAWCLQDRIPLVNGAWWNDNRAMENLVNALHQRFLELGFCESACDYFLDSCLEALDAYHRDLSSEPSPLGELDIPQLIELVQTARETYPNFESEDYGDALPSWLISKEQLIWNIVVCALYGPASARPLLVDSPALLAKDGYAGKTDVITELAQTSFMRYTADRIASQTDMEYATFASLPTDLRNSSIAYISSIHKKLETLGYEVLPAGSCYPDRCVSAFTASEVECLAILEHRRWLRERQKAGWHYGPAKNTTLKESPYIVPWEELPDRAKEWNRSAVRSIPSLLASVNLAVVR